jgi:hypothetical protein
MLAQIEAAIADRLAQALKHAGADKRGVKLFSHPDSPAELGRVQQRVQVLLGYKGANFADLGEEPMHQTMQMTWEVSIQVANLRSHAEAYPVLDLVRAALTGFIPIAGPVRALRPRSERFIALQNGVWYYLMEYLLPVTWPSEFEDLKPGLPDDWALSGVEVGLWRSLIGGVPDPNRSNLDAELLIDGTP